MKNIILAVTVTLAIFASTGAFARGFSVGVLGSYAVDNGAVEKSTENFAKDLPMDIPFNRKIEYSPPVISGIAIFLKYDFHNNFFIRTGFDYNYLVTGAKFSSYEDMGLPNYLQHKMEINYESYTTPLYLGMNLSPDKGRTSVYLGIGAYYAMIGIKRNWHIIDNGGIYAETKRKSDKDSSIFGPCAIIGMERILFSKTYLMFEYSVFSGEKVKHESGEGLDVVNSLPIDYNFIERYGLPSQQLRLGLRYDF